MKRLSVGILGSFIAGFSVSVNAGLLVDPIGGGGEGKKQVGVYYSSATTAYEYKVSDGEKYEADLKRKGITIYGAYGLDDVVDVYAGFSYNMTTDIDNIDGESFGINGESGFDFGAGIRGELLDLDSMKLVGYAQLEYVTDDLGSEMHRGTGWEDGFESSTSGFEFSGGVLALFEVSDKFSMYGGLDLIPFSTMEIEFEEYDKNLYSGVREDSKDSYDLERGNVLGVRIGAKYMMNDEMFVRGEFSAVSEKSFTIGAGTNF